MEGAVSNINQGVKSLRDTYNRKSDSRIYRTEFGDGYFFGLDRWEKQGMPQDISFKELFQWDEPGKINLGGRVGDNILVPYIEYELVEEMENYVITRDYMGRLTKSFKKHDLIYMPEYIGHAVTSWNTWLADVKPRLNPHNPERYEGIGERIEKAKIAIKEGKMVYHEIDGGFMYLRDLLGPQDLLFTLVDEPDLIHDMMEAWFKVHDRTIALYQEHVTIDELYVKEDICYKTSSLISPDMMNEFLFPYYRKLIENTKKRQLDASRHLYLGVDSDGHIESVISLYQKEGFEIFSPFEVAAGCDVVELGRIFPDIIISGGIDKRILAGSKEEINNHLEAIIPAMRKRGGYIPTCDHGIPEDVSYENYMYYRKRCVELGG